MTSRLLILLPALCFFFTDPAPTEIYTLSLHDALPICSNAARTLAPRPPGPAVPPRLAVRSEAGLSSRIAARSEEHTSELQSLRHLVCRLLLEKKNKQNKNVAQD